MARSRPTQNNRSLRADGVRQGRLKILLQELHRPLAGIEKLQTAESVPGSGIELHLVRSSCSLEQLLQARSLRDRNHAVVFSVKDQHGRMRVKPCNSSGIPPKNSTTAFTRGSTDATANARYPPSENPSRPIRFESTDGL